MIDRGSNHHWASPVRDAITELLHLTLPGDLQASAPRFAQCVTQHPEVAPHIGKRWGELSESQANIVAREVGLVAHAAAYRPANAATFD